MEILDWTDAGNPTKFRMRKPDDMHEHFRDGEMLGLVAPMVTKRFRSAIVMPNLVPPVTTTTMAFDYRNRLLSSGVDKPEQFLPMMTFYLTDTLDPGEVAYALEQRVIIGIKYYPPGLTTNSESGVKNAASLWTEGTKPHECLRWLAHYNGVLLLHAADGIAAGAWDNEERFYDRGDGLDPYDQEPHFICNTLPRICDAHPDLKISVEHLSTALGADWLRSNGGEKLGCSLTAQHLLLDRRDSFKSGKQMGFNPHRFWWPVVQSTEHQQELCKLATEDHPFVYLGSDSAPHPIDKKESSCCVGGVLMAHAGIEFYAEAFENKHALDDRFERFASINGRTFYDIDAFYDLTPSDETITLERKEWEVKPFFIGEYVAAGGYSPVIPFRLGETVRWKLVD